MQKFFSLYHTVWLFFVYDRIYSLSSGHIRCSFEVKGHKADHGGSNIRKITKMVYTSPISYIVAHNTGTLFLVHTGDWQFKVQAIFGPSSLSLKNLSGFTAVVSFTKFLLLCHVYSSCIAIAYTVCCVYCILTFCRQLCVR